MLIPLSITIKKNIKENLNTVILNQYDTQFITGDIVELKTNE